MFLQVWELSKKSNCEIPLNVLSVNQICIFAVRVIGGMSLRNGTWHGLRNDIVMRNLIYRKWHKEIVNQTGKHARVSAAPF